MPPPSDVKATYPTLEALPRYGHDTQPTKKSPAPPERHRARDSGVPWSLGQALVDLNRPKAAPCGSVRMANSPPSYACGGTTWPAPSSTARSLAAFTLSTPKYTSQWLGVPAGVCGFSSVPPATPSPSTWNSA